MGRVYICGNSSVVEHHVANVGVASSNLVSRSKKKFILKEFLQLDVVFLKKKNGHNLL